MIPIFINYEYHYGMDFSPILVLLGVQEIPYSIHHPATSYPVWDFPRSIQKNLGIFP
jgi:hypothetical protein